MNHCLMVFVLLQSHENVPQNASKGKVVHENVVGIAMNLAKREDVGESSLELWLCCFKALMVKGTAPRRLSHLQDAHGLLVRLGLFAGNLEHLAQIFAHKS